jgi:hypothetical protein
MAVRKGARQPFKQAYLRPDLSVTIGSLDDPEAAPPAAI